MSKPIHPLALFRLSVLGSLASRDHLERGELKKIIQELVSGIAYYFVMSLDLKKYFTVSPKISRDIVT